MDKALACAAGNWGSYSDNTKDSSAPILSDTPSMCTLSLTMPVVTWSSVNTCLVGGKVMFASV